jgi:hypothetical protein
MAVTISKNYNKITKNFDFKKLVDDCILSMINRILGIKRPIFIKGVTYFTTYTLCKDTFEKTVSSIHMSYRDKTSGVITLREIEVSGASIVEFIDYLEINGANEIKNYTRLLEEI